MKKTVWSLLEQHPPALVRLMARRKIGTKRVVALLDEEIAVRSGIPTDEVKWIYQQRTWNEVPFGKMQKFIEACEFDPTSSADRNRANAYLHQRGGPRYSYLKQSPAWGSVFYPLILSLKK